MKKIFAFIVLCTVITSLSACGTKECTEHKYSEWNITKQASCIEDGQQTRICSVCKKEETEFIKLKGHTYSEWKTVSEATCSMNGHEERTCTVCGNIESNSLPKKEHSFNNPMIEKAATCAETGLMTGTCTICGEKDTEVIPATGNHKFGKWTVTAEATCTTKGIEEATCSACNQTQSREVAMKDHSFGAWTIKTEATCTAKGSEEATCKTCGKSQTREIALKEHTFGTWAVKTEATCATKGSEESTCNICGKSQIRELDLKDHTLGQWIITKESTCLETGKKQATCSVCNKTIEESIQTTAHKIGTDGICALCNKYAMTDKEISDTKNVTGYYINWIEDNINDRVEFIFEFYSGNESEYYKIPATVELNVKNADGSSVYSGKHLLTSKSYSGKTASFTIPYSKFSNMVDAYCYFHVYNDYIDFTTGQLTMPVIFIKPKTVAINRVASYNPYSATLSNFVAYYQFTVDGREGYRMYFDGNITSNPAKTNVMFTWTLSDARRNIIKNSNFILSSFSEGPFKNDFFGIYDLKPGNTYFLDIKSMPQ